MKLSDLLAEESVIPDLKATDKTGVLEELVEVLRKHDPSLDKNALVKVLLERERLGSTGIGDGIAIPHGKFYGVDRPIISFGRSRKGLEFDSVDGEPAYLFFLLVAPENSASVHLKALAKISRMLMSQVFRESLMGSDGADEIMRLITEKDAEF